MASAEQTRGRSPALRQPVRLPLGVLLVEVTVFGDPMAISFPDPDHSQREHRFLTFELSRFERLLVVAHTDRGDRVRIINARLMTRHERKIYEES
jgi:hypothetical protein